ncbi:ankyrin repeat-containing domain protein [Trichoderma barbatum]
MATSKNKYSYQDYTVAWICALPLEIAAATAMLDETHPSLPAKPNDDNQYVLGRIYAHNVVISCLPCGVYGTTSATTVATQMRSSFESIRFFLMVGIGGGAPSKKDDIRLGDVVVSRPTRDLGGVVQYDFGKAISGGRFQRIGVLNKPPPVLLSAISILQATSMSKPNNISSLITEMATRDDHMSRTFAYPGEDQDILFDHEYDHPESEETCRHCDKKRLIKRPSRAGPEPLIHYGLIASGNQVVKDGHVRDKMVRELGVLCFEMEAAGLMDNFPCLVVRGICDYSDSHKNKQWQNYAAAAAAAYTKQLLSVIHTNQVSDTPPVNMNVSLYTGDTPFRVRPSTEMVLHRNIDEKLLRRISSYDHEKVQRKLSQKRLVGTTQWFLDHPDFAAWLAEKGPFNLWCSGKIGSGKTMIATAVVEAVKYRSSKPNSPTVFFYCDYEHSDGPDASYIISSFIKQLCEFLYKTSGHYLGEIVQDLRKFFGPRRIQPDFDEIQDFFTKLFYAMPGTTYIVDGIDALSEVHASRFLKLIQRLFCSPEASKQSRILLLSRDQIPGYINIDTFIPGIRRISTTQNIVQDIKIYIETSIFDKMMYRKLTGDGELLEDIKKILLSESSDMFLWVYLQLEILWDTCHTDAEIRSALATLPKDIEETYRRCVGRIDFQNKWALKVLKWVSFANRPLHIEELREAVAFDCTDTEWDANKKPQSEFIIGCCANLVVMDHSDKCVRFAHSSVKQYLEEDRNKITAERCIPGYPTETNGDLECGEYCVSYLSLLDFSLQIIKSAAETPPIAVPSPISIAKTVSGTGTRLSKLFFPQLRSQKSSVSISFRTIHTPAAPNRNQYTLLDYVVTNWALHTKQLSRTSSAWEKFEQLATCFNETWNFHPWVPGGRSKESQLHGLFGWAVKEQHKPLLSIVHDSGPLLRKVCDLPLVGEGLPALHIASKLGYRDIIEILLKLCDVNNVDQDGCTPLHYAASRGHTEVARLLLLQKEIKLDVNSKFQCTPLWIAASNGHEGVVSLLIENGANVEVKDSVDGRSPLSSAVKNGRYLMVGLLLEKGANMESRDASSHTPLTLAIIDRDKAMIDLLLNNGAKLDTKFKYTQPLLLWAAENSLPVLLKLYIEKCTSRTYQSAELATSSAKNGHEVVLKLLLGKGKWYDLEDLLLLAAQNGHEEVVKLLLENGATPYADVKHPRPLRSAVTNGHERVVKLLFKHTQRRIVRQLVPLAVENGHEAVVQFLLQQASNHDYHDLLSLAVRHGHEVLVRIFLDKVPIYYSQELLLLAEKYQHDKVVNIFFEIVTAYGFPNLLPWAAENGCTMTVKLLLENGADPDTKDKHGATPLYLAAGLGYEAVVKLLLERGADPNVKKDNKSWTPLFWAASSGHEEITRLLLENGADLDATVHNGQNALFLAISNGHAAVVNLLLERGASLEFRDQDGQPPLSCAIKNWNEAIISLLLEKEARLDFQSPDYLPFLLVALEKGHEALIQALLSDIICLNIQDEKDYNERTPLHYVVAKAHEAGAELLLKSGANPNIKDQKGRTPLHHATETYQEISMKLLLEHSADPNIVDHNGRTPLHFAAGGRYIAELGIQRSLRYLPSMSSWLQERDEIQQKTSIKLLLEYNADPNIKDHSGRTPLHYAVEGQQSSVKLLIEVGSGRTPLHHAAYNGVGREVIELLLEHGADPNAKDGRRQTPLHYAVMRGNMEASQRLLQYGATPRQSLQYQDFSRLRRSRELLIPNTRQRRRALEDELRRATKSS